MPVIIDEHTQYFNNGASVVNGFVYIGKANTDPTILANRLTLFSDAVLTIVVPNPQRTNARGQTLDGPIFTAEGSFSFELQNSGSVVIESILSMGATTGGLSLTTLFDVLGINALTAKGDPIVVAYVDKQQFSLTIISEPTGAMTLDIDGNGVIPIKNKGIDILPGQLPANGIIVVAFNIIGPVFELVSGGGDELRPREGAAVASAAQPNIWAQDGQTIHITGTDQIDDFTDAPRIGAKVTLIFDDVLTLKNGLGITLQGGADIITAAGDRVEVYADAVDAFSGVYIRNVPPSAFASQLFHVEDSRSPIADGGTFTSGANRTRDLNNVVTNQIVGASLSANQVILPDGTYYIEASAPAKEVNAHFVLLRNITGGSDLLEGTRESASGTNAGGNRAFISGTFTLSGGPSAIELQHQCQTTQATDGFGSGSFNLGSVRNIFSVLKIWKVG